MKNSVTLALIFSVAVISSHVHAYNDEAESQQKPCQRGNAYEQVFERLDLTEIQRQQLNEIREQMRSERQQQKEARLNSLREVLTEEQWETFSQERQQARQKMKDRKQNYQRRCGEGIIPRG